MGPPAYSKWMRADEFGPKISLLERLFAHYKQCNTSPNNPSPSPEESSGETSLVSKGDQSTDKMVPVLSFYSAQSMDQPGEEGLPYHNDAAKVAEVLAKGLSQLSQLSQLLTPYHDQVTVHLTMVYTLL